jgi:hypothetical protein
MGRKSDEVGWFYGEQAVLGMMNQAAVEVNPNVLAF